MKTTLNKIKEQNPCKEGWEQLLTFLNKTQADDEELSLLTILESNGLRDTLWSLKCVEGFDREIRLMACDFAESVVHLANDERSINAIKVSRDYANKLATEEELIAAWAAALDAARAAAWTTASDAARAAARAAAKYAAMAVRAAWYASDAEEEKQIEIFKKYCK